MSVGDSFFEQLDAFSVSEALCLARVWWEMDERGFGGEGRGQVRNLASIDLTPMGLRPMDLASIDLTTMAFGPMDLASIELTPMGLGLVDLASIDVTTMGLEPMDLEPIDLTPMALEPAEFGIH